MWENIEPGKESNFNMYNSSVITDYGVEYDVESIMHYSRQAFSKNGQDTIVPIQNISELGQRNGFTDKDIQKLDTMYKDDCNEPEIIDIIPVFDWFQSLF